VEDDFMVFKVLLKAHRVY